MSRCRTVGRAKWRRLVSAVVGLVLVATAWPARAKPITYSAHLTGIDVTLDSERYFWAGGLITGNINVAATPYAITTNPSTGEVAALFSFTGSVKLDGTQLEYGPSYVAVFHTPSPTDPDDIRFAISVVPFNVAPNLQLLNFGFETSYSNTLTYAVFPSLDDLITLIRSFPTDNLLAVPRSDVIFASGGDSYEFSAVPEPDALPLFAIGLGLMGWFGWRKKKTDAG